MQDVAEREELKAGVILSGVGGLKKAHLRFPSTPRQQHALEWEGDLEIVSMIGTISASGMHIHLSVSDTKGSTFGGHLRVGCTVRNTVELVIGLLDGVEFSRAVDAETGFEELVIKKLKA
jgi:predicted DNA-binding protein with PD1-like motif